MKKRTKVILSILLVILLLITGGAIWQWKNLKAVGEAVRYSKEELAARIDEQKASVESTLKEYGLEAVVDFTFEEEEAIRKGEMTYEEAVERLTQRQQEALSGSKKENNEQSGANTEFAEGAGSVENGNTADENSSNGKVQNSGSQSSTAQNKDSSKAIIQGAVNQMYALKAKYLGQLGGIERAAVSEYRALSAEEKKSGAAKAIVSKYMNPVLSAQSSCDNEVASLLSDLKVELQSKGESTEIVKTIKAAYEREKELKKAYYLSLVK